MLVFGRLCRAGAGIYVRWAVQTTHKIPGDGAAAFADYLTSTSRRGDYYLGQDGEGDRAEGPEGRWHGPPATLRGFGVDPEGPVDREALVSLMGGVAPATGEPFRRVGGDGSRVAGIDLTFSLATRTRGSKATTAAVEVDGVWRAVGEEYGLPAGRVEGLFGDGERFEQRDLAAGLLADVCRERSTVSDRDLWARAYELSAGTCHPREVGRVVDGLVARGELVGLEDGSWTIREIRQLERQTVELAEDRGAEAHAPVGRQSLQRARAGAEIRIGARLSAEQEHALDVVTGQGGVSVLVGQAGTGKGVVISAAREAWEADGHRVMGIAVAGATAKRLAADTGIVETMTTDALLGRVQSGRLGLDERSVVVMDEAGMADTRRLAALTQATSASRSKLVLVGDQAQLSSIGAGGLFDSVRVKVPTAELTEVHRAREGWERDAWARVRSGDAAPALAAYRSHERLHVSNTREEAGERMVDDWDQARREVEEGGCVMIGDASNAELDRLNAMAQDRRLEAGELGEERAELPGRPYGLHAGDEVLLTGALYEPGRERVENGTRAQVTHARGPKVALRTEEPQPREVRVDTRRFSEVRLAYAQHVYKAQGATVDRALVLTGGWQTDRESAYVALTRAREPPTSTSPEKTSARTAWTTAPSSASQSASRQAGPSRHRSPRPSHRGRRRSAGPKSRRRRR